MDRRWYSRSIRSLLGLPRSRLNLRLAALSAVFALSLAPLAYADSLDEPNFDEFTGGYRYKLMPLLGYHFGMSEFTGTTQLSHGPQGSLRLWVRNESGFFFPDASAGMAFNLGSGTVTFWTMGFGAGGQFDSGLGIWFGLLYQGFLSFDSVGGFAGRAAIYTASDFSHWELEFRIGKFPVDLADRTDNFPMISAHISYGFR